MHASSDIGSPSEAGPSPEATAAESADDMAAESSPEAFATGAGVVAAEAADADAGRATESAAAPVDVAVARAEAGVASESVQKIDTPQRRNIRFMLILDFLSWHPLLVPTPCQNT